MYICLLHLTPKFNIMDKVQVYIDQAVELIMLYAPKVILAVLTLWIGLKVIKFLSNQIRTSLEKSNFEETLAKFLANLMSWVLKVLLFISVASMIGIETTSFVAIMGAAGLAIGLSLQGSLANFAGGLLIILFKPYKIGDLIEAQGRLGQVLDIQIFTTVLVNTVNQKIIIPNGAISNGDIVNYSANGKIRVDQVVGISYDSDIKKAKEVLMAVMQNHAEVLNDPAPTVGVIELGDSSVNLTVRPWCVPDDYWQMQLDMMEGSKLALDEAGITIPFPQMDVHLDKQV